MKPINSYYYSPLLSSFLQCVALVVYWVATSNYSYAASQEWHGNAKYTLQSARYPEDSIYHDYFGTVASDNLLSGRVNWKLSQEAWDVQVDYQAMAYHSERLDFQNTLFTGIGNSQYPDDANRLFDLTKVLHDGSDNVVLHRLDRMNVGYAQGDWVFRFGRQVASWGNGLLFNPVDFFNPFDPAALDKEYKVGDDMLYAEHLFANGDDVQAVIVVRRDDAGDVSGDVASEAIKYHAWLESWLPGAELELVVAQHYRDELLSLGLVSNLGDALWRGELMMTYANDKSTGTSQSENHWVTSFVSNLSYSWVWGGKNVTGVAEYFYNGFGLTGEYSLERLVSNGPLYSRLTRGELYTVSRHYLGLSGSVELSPLWVLSPNVFINLADQSSLVQLSLSHDLAQNWRMLAAINLPLGGDGTEYGGLNVEVLDAPLSTDLGFFFQTAYYF